jgi:hypothetical protein
MRTTTLLTRKCDRLKMLRWLPSVAFVGLLVTGGSGSAPRSEKEPLFGAC